MALWIIAGIGLGVAGTLVWARVRRKKPLTAREIAEREATDVAELVKVFMADTDSTFVLLDSDMRIADINHLAEFPDGTRREDLIGRRVQDIVPEMADSGWHHRFRTVMDTGRSLTGDDYLPHPRRGSKGRVKITAVRLGERMGFIARDITNEPQLDELIRWGRGRWEALVERMPSLIVIVDESGSIGFVNRTVSDAGRDQVVGRAFTEFLDPEYREKGMKALRNVLAGEGEERYEAEGYHLDGSKAWYDIRVGRIEDGSRARSAMIVATDITSRRAMEDELRASERAYRTFFDVVPIGILVADVETMKIGYANPAVCAMFGMSPEQMKGRGVRDIHPKAELDFVVAEFRAQAQREKELAERIPCVRGDGTVFHADFRTVPAIIAGRQCNIGCVTLSAGGVPPGEAPRTES